MAAVGLCSISYANMQDEEEKGNEVKEMKVKRSQRNIMAMQKKEAKEEEKKQAGSAPNNLAKFPLRTI